jgi:hypothetical protein
MHVAINIKKSPIRFINKALSEDLPACILVCQKPINKYEHKPTPSQPKKSIIKLSERTRTIIKNVNKDK